MARYYFEKIETGQIREEYTVIEIENHFAEIGNDDESAMLLAEKNGGVIEAIQDKPVRKSKVIQEEEVTTNG